MFPLHFVALEDVHIFQAYYPPILNLKQLPDQLFFFCKQDSKRMSFVACRVSQEVWMLAVRQQKQVIRDFQISMKSPNLSLQTVVCLVTLSSCSLATIIHANGKTEITLLKYITLQGAFVSKILRNEMPAKWGPPARRCHQCLIIKDNVPDWGLFKKSTISIGQDVQR